MTAAACEQRRTNSRNSHYGVDTCKMSDACQTKASVMTCKCLLYLTLVFHHSLHTLHQTGTADSAY